MDKPMSDRHFKFMAFGYKFRDFFLRRKRILDEVGIKEASSRLYQVAPHGTTVLVDSGIYAAVRHPQYLFWMFFSAAIILIAQNWLVTIIGIASMLTIYMQARQDDESLIKKFGSSYKRYMQFVPRMNILVGVIRVLRRRKSARL